MSVSVLPFPSMEGRDENISTPSISMDLSQYLWDTRQSGNARARLTPWAYPEHRDAVNQGIKILEATDPVTAKEVAKAYKELEEAQSPTITETVTIKAKPSEKVTETTVKKEEVKKTVKLKA